MSPNTIAVTAGRPVGPGVPLNQPIVLASNYRDTGDYTRTQGTETWVALEDAIGALEGGRALAFSSGMAAAAAAIYALAPKVVVFPSVSYMGVRALLAEYQERGHLELRPVDVTDTAAVAAAAEGADMVWVETPTNPTLDVADLETIGHISRAVGATMVVDSTFATPLLQRPLEHGATIVMHSGTKFIGGHSDLLIGLCVTSDDDVYERLVKARTFQGATPGALEAFLALRGLRTMPLRLEASQRNAATLVDRLRAHRAVAVVNYPGLGAMVSFVMKGGPTAADAVCERVQIIVAATSLGGVETTIERRQKYAGDAHVEPGLLRMSVGIEDINDLWADLSAALR
ncbi:MAG: aminotransferase class I/II-fold pyridoxal phosphate-dependent enzyme [Actinobacteria bacterium]|nr:aminotransferase class I/II-fold pyridoxal phosphate-dependent enzyme [Actinomycetota bacterium]